MTFGVRPEDLVTATNVRNKFKVKIDVVEPLGAETYIYVSTKEGAQLIASVDPHLNLKVGDEIDLSIVIDIRN